MSKKELQRDIKQGGGYILSDGTLNLQHLIPKALDVMNYYRLGGVEDLKKRMVDCFSFNYPEQRETTLKHHMAWHYQYHGQMVLENHEEANEVWGDTCDFFQSIAPKGYYFGSSEGDGALIGWWGGVTDE